MKIQKEQADSQGDMKVSSQFRCISTILSKQLAIPNYQRPYVWTQKNVEQLLSDINNARGNGKLKYLIGSIILHKPAADKEQLYIVDGQQRLTTICLILRALGYKDAMPSLMFNHSESFNHIKQNYDYIQRWCACNLSNSAREDFGKYLIDACYFVEITVTDLTEAFQLFETQNGRGKELEAYNLLKAYHIRAMGEAPQEDKHRCDIRWENAAMYADRECIRYDLLHQIINEHLYRIRQWSKGCDAGQFSKKEIDEFKGVTISKTGTLDFAYQNIILQQIITHNYLKSMNLGRFRIKERFKYGDPENMNPFASINQLIINGEPFFDYIETYVEIYKRLFIDVDSSSLADFKDFYKTNCKNYTGAYRIGDGYVRQVYKSIIMLTFDRFGEVGVNDIYKELYAIVYWLRLSKRQVRYSTMTKKENVGWLFSHIGQAKTLSDLFQIKEYANYIKDCIERETIPFSVPEIESAIKSI